MKFQDLTGKRFGKLIVVSRAPNKYNATRWICKCDCGNETIVRGSCLRVGHTTSCKCWKRNHCKLRPFESIYNTLVKGAHRLKREITLTYEQFVDFSKNKTCHYCGCDVEWQEYKTWNSSSSRYNLDRKDNKLGYSKENCVVCCPLCNFIKGSILTHDEMKILGSGIAQIQQQRKQNYVSESSQSNRGSARQ